MNYGRTLQEICNIAGKECLFSISFKKLTTAYFPVFATKYVDLLNQYKLIDLHPMVSSFIPKITIRLKQY